MRRLPGRGRGAGRHAAELAWSRRVTAYHLERAWLPATASHDDVLRRGRRRPVHRGRRPTATATRADPAAAVDDPRPRQLPQPRLPPGAARPHPARARDVLDLARADVRRRRPARPRHLLRAGAGDLPRDGRGRHHVRGGVPLPAPPARRDAVRRPERDGAGARRRPPGRPGIRITLLDTCYLARDRRAARGGAAAVQRRRRRTLGGAGRRAGGLRRRRRATSSSAPRSTPSAPCPATELDARRGLGRAKTPAARAPLRAGRGERRLPRRPTASRPTEVLAEAGALGRRRAPCTPPTSPTATSRCIGGARGRTPASAPPPSATSATASARRRALARRRRAADARLATATR